MEGESSYTKKILLSVAVSIIILTAWNYLFPSKTKNQSKAPQSTQTSKNINTTPSIDSINPIFTPEDAIKTTSSQRVVVNTSKTSGSINLKGLTFDNLVLNDYTIDQKTDNKINLLNPLESKEGFTADFKFLSTDQNLILPNDQTLWQLKSQHEQTTTFAYTNPQNIEFNVSITPSQDYLFSISYLINNATKNEINSVSFVSRIQRYLDYHAFKSNVVSHEGFVGYFDEKFNEISYKKVNKSDANQISINSNQIEPTSWFGISDKYWLTAFLSPNEVPNNITIRKVSKNTLESYQIFSITPPQTVSPNATLKGNISLFSGPKKLDLLQHYAKSQNASFFDRAIDFGMLYFLTKPILQIMQFFNKFIHNYGITIILLTILVKLILFPIATKSYISMAKMKSLQPEIKVIREKYSSSKLAMNKAISDLYRIKQVNPLSGCLPTFIQIPIFFALYKVFFTSIELRHAPFMLWIHDLSAQDPTSIVNLFGLLPFAVPSVLKIGVLPILMGITMYWQQTLSPQSHDPIQSKMMKVLPIFFTFMLAQFPAGLIIYWTVNNSISIIHQMAIEKFWVKEIKSLD